MTPELEEKLYAKYPKILVENAGFYGRGCPLGIGWVVLSFRYTMQTLAVAY
jgi:hypothetical protein